MIHQNFIQLYEKSFSQNWDLPALSDYNGVTYTYGEVARQVARLHLVYEAAGIKKGDKVAVFGKNSANWCVSFMSVITYGPCLDILLCISSRSSAIPSLANISKKRSMV